jgi:hypothetical protein
MVTAAPRLQQLQLQPLQLAAAPTSAIKKCTKHNSWRASLMRGAHVLLAFCAEVVCLYCWRRSSIEQVRGQQSGTMNAHLFLIKGGPCFICRWAAGGRQAAA